MDGQGAVSAGTETAVVVTPTLIMLVDAIAVDEAAAAVEKASHIGHKVLV